MDSRDRQYSSEVLPGIFKISLPIPGKQPGPVNAYLFQGDPLTLLDTGMKTHAGRLRLALEELGYSFSDIRQIVITHGHVDHYGSAKTVRDEGGAVVLAHAEEIPYISTTTTRSAYRKNARFLAIIGVPVHLRLSFRLMRHFFYRMADCCPVDRALAAGDRVRLGSYEGTVIETPGHSKGSICLYLEKERALFSGDHILKHVTPNAFIMFEDEYVMPRRSSQREYYESLAAVEKLNPVIVFTAHGNNIDNLAETTGMYRRCFEERQRAILGIMREGKRDVYSIARRLFPEIGGKRRILDIYLAVSEVYTHLQVLESGGMVRREKKGRRLFFEIEPPPAYLP
ncbi:MAG: MBL fold metallo-hydrolase [Spirochaetes bacterium]|jgi:glyoxylase-like metal-dependent hydrolase (beta-lactamase superfamily II)|nr:MBL fold metallo-hydrolase [Spirochaetota bacterium]